MRIGVISDTHGNLEAISLAYQVLGEVDLVVHAGDVLYHPPRLTALECYNLPGTVEFLNNSKIPLVIAQGNCDAQVYEELLDCPVSSPYAFARVNNTGVIASHGHLLRQSDFLRLAGKFGADIAISGHTHIPVLKKTDGLIFMNPGSPALPKYEIDGVPTPSIGLITDDKAVVMSIPDEKVLMEISR